MATGDSTFEMSEKVAKRLKKDEPPQPAKLDNNTLIPISVMIGVMSTVVMVVWTYAGLTHRIEEMEHRFEDRNRIVKDWVRLLKAANSDKGIVVPEWQD